jgi:hypothetical protein
MAFHLPSPGARETETLYPVIFENRLLGRSPTRRSFRFSVPTTMEVTLMSLIGPQSRSHF